MIMGMRALARQRRMVLFAMCLATFMTSFDLTIVNVALPSLQAELRMSAAGLEWVISAYSLSLAAVIPAAGVLGDRFGRKRVFLAGMVVFTGGVVACALAWDAGALIAFRAVQGVGGAAMLALGLSIVAEAYPAGERAGAIGAWAAIGGTGFGAGPVGGGVLLTFFGWQSVFWVNLPFALLGIVCTAAAVRESRNPLARRLDVVGMVLCGVGLTCVTFAFVESSVRWWGSVVVVGPFGVGIGFVVAFFWWERRAPFAMLPAALLRARSFVGASGVYLLCYGGMSGALFWVTLYFQDVAGWSVLRTGLSWLFMNVPFLAMAQFGGRLDARFRTVSVVVAGILVAAVGVFLLSRAGTVPFFVCAVGYVLYGGGFGAFVPATTHAAMRDVPAGASGAASSVLNASRQIGSSVCVAVFGAVGVHAAGAGWRRGGSGAGEVRGAAVGAFLQGYQVAVGLAGGCTVVAAGVAYGGFRGRRERERERESAMEVVAPDSGGEGGCDRVGGDWWERVVGRGR